jgi:hypothetical protein
MRNDESGAGGRDLPLASMNVASLTIEMVCVRVCTNRPLAACSFIACRKDGSVRKFDLRSMVLKAVRRARLLAGRDGSSRMASSEVRDGAAVEDGRMRLHSQGDFCPRQVAYPIAGLSTVPPPRARSMSK